MSDKILGNFDFNGFSSQETLDAQILIANDPERWQKVMQVVIRVYYGSDNPVQDFELGLREDMVLTAEQLKNVDFKQLWIYFLDDYLMNY